MKILINYLILITGVVGVTCAMAEDVEVKSVQMPEITLPINKPDGTPGIVPNTQPINNYANKGINNYLPIKTEGMTAGDVKAREIHTQLMQPLFLVGSDEKSLNWLKNNCESLKKMNALGLLVQAATEAEINAVKDQCQGQSIIPAPANALIKTYQLDHYPVLITKEGISQ